MVLHQFAKVQLKNGQLFYTAPRKKKNQDNVVLNKYLTLPAPSNTALKKISGRPY